MVGELVLVTNSLGPPVVGGISDHHGRASPFFELFFVCVCVCVCVP